MLRQWFYCTLNGTDSSACPTVSMTRPMQLFTRDGTAYTILGVPHYNSSIMGPKTPAKLLRSLY